MAKKDVTPDTNSPEKWFTVKEAAEYLGVSQPTIFRWMKDEVLSFYKIGGSTRFSQEGLDALIEKSTGAKEAEQVMGKCVACGNNVLVDGRLQGAGRLYFKPNKTKFWTLRESLVPTKARVCAACGYVHHYADTEKLKSLKAETVRMIEESEAGGIAATESTGVTS